MTTISIDHLELRREVLETVMGTDVHGMIMLDGRPLTEWFAFLAGRESGWIGWPDDMDWEGLLTGRTAAPEWGGRSELCVCGCTCTGCDPLLARIVMGDTQVLWTDLAHSCTILEVPGVAFQFDRADYEQAIADFRDWDGTLHE